uniref:Uncharacterized protein n=1 Tax=Favella ehrenbergii TaxID=182087 RepID=A0A7S3I6I7_9SPIT
MHTAQVGLDSSILLTPHRRERLLDKDAFAIRLIDKFDLIENLCDSCIHHFGYSVAQTLHTQLLRLQLLHIKAEALFETLFVDILSGNELAPAVLPLAVLLLVGRFYEVLVVLLAVVVGPAHEMPRQREVIVFQIINAQLGHSHGRLGVLGLTKRADRLMVDCSVHRFEQFLRQIGAEVAALKQISRR